jgi:elongation factor P--beta-lysine ligase
LSIGIRHSVFIIRHSKFDIRHSAFVIRQSSFVIRHSQKDFSMSRYRQTQLEANLRLRAHVIRIVRDFFTAQGYLEVDTPLRIPAPIPEAHIDAMASGDWFLQTSPEVCMKRLLAAGYPRIFQICKCFRQAERGARHLPELTMLEWYHAGWTYQEMMNQCEELIGFLAAALSGDETITSRVNSSICRSLGNA